MAVWESVRERTKSRIRALKCTYIHNGDGDGGGGGGGGVVELWPDGIVRRKKKCGSSLQ